MPEGSYTRISRASRLTASPVWNYSLYNYIGDNRSACTSGLRFTQILLWCTAPTARLNSRVRARTYAFVFASVDTFAFYIVGTCLLVARSRARYMYDRLSGPSLVVTLSPARTGFIMSRSSFAQTASWRKKRALLDCRGFLLLLLCYESGIS